MRCCLLGLVFLGDYVWGDECSGTSAYRAALISLRRQCQHHHHLIMIAVLCETATVSQDKKAMWIFCPHAAELGQGLTSGRQCLDWLR